MTGQKCIVNEDEDVEGNKIVSIQCGTMKFSCIAPNDSEGGSGSGSGGEKPTEPTDPTDPVEPVPSGSETDKTPETGNGALL